MTRMWWYVARASGLVAWAMLAASVLWGLAISTRSLARRVRTSWLVDLHRFLGAAAVIFTAVHVVGIVADSYVHFGLVEVLVPFTGNWHPAAVAWGIVATYLLAAVWITSLIRDRLSERAWRFTHFLSFPVFVLATTHLLTAGTDRHSPLVQATVFAASAAVAALTAIRVANATRVTAQVEAAWR